MGVKQLEQLNVFEGVQFSETTLVLAVALIW
jgi:hypothetical protein